MQSTFPQIMIDNIVNNDRKREESLIDFNELQDTIEDQSVAQEHEQQPSVSIPFSLPPMSVPEEVKHQHARPQRHHGHSQTQSEESSGAEEDDDSYPESSVSSHHRKSHRRRHHKRHSKPSPPKDVHKDHHERDIKDSVNNFTKFKDEFNAYHVDEHSEKLELLSRIQQFQNEGITSIKKVTAFSPLDELRYELYRMSREFERNRSVTWMQQSLVTSIRMMEMANRRFDPFGLRLDGFSRTVSMNLDDYKPALLGIHSRYGSTRVQSGNPVIQLLFTLAGSLLFHHVSQISKEETEADRPLTSVGKVISSLAGKNIKQKNPFSKMKGPPDTDDDDDDSD